MRQKWIGAVPEQTPFDPYPFADRTKTYSSGQHTKYVTNKGFRIGL